MPDIDPAALGRTESIINGSSTPSISSKPLPGSNTGAQKQGKPAPSAPRVDIESTYTLLKIAIGEHWNTYKEAISRFVLGSLSQAELTRLIENYICSDPNREHLHNQLICAIYANALRDQPDQPVAGWVSANEKPTAVPKPVAGDAAEQRLKLEVMQLPPRIRQRLKGVQDEPFNRITHDLVLHTQSKRPLPLVSTANASSIPTPATASSAAGLNTETEIRKRYSQPLASETRDIPGSSFLTDRIVPMCYEEGLPSGIPHPAPCVELLSTGLDTFVKEVVSNILSRSRTDAPVSGPDLATPIASGTQNGTAAPPPPVAPPAILPFGSTVGLGSARTASGIMTSRYKRRLQAEEAAFSRGEIKRSETGLLPIEVAAAVTQNGVIGSAGDLRVAWETHEPWLAAMMPWLGEKVVLGEYPFNYVEPDGFDEDVSMADELDLDIGPNGHTLHQLNGFTNTAGAVLPLKAVSKPKVNGFPLTNGVHHEIATSADDDVDYGWEGSSTKARASLSALLDDCLAIGL